MTTTTVPDTMVSDGCIKLELAEGQPIARLLLSRPAKRNALSFKMTTEFIEAIGTLSKNDVVKVVIISGEGPDVTSGLDADELYNLYALFPGGGGKFPSQRARVLYQEQLWGAQGMFQRLLGLRKMVVFEAKGLCYDIGLYLSLCCDLVVATTDLQIGNPRWKFAGADGDLSLLTATLGPKRAKQLVFVDNVIDAQRAKEWKLVDLVVEPADLEHTAVALATTLSGIPRDGIVTGKHGSAGHFAEHMDRAVIRAAVLSNILFRDGEFNFLRERRNRGTKAAMQAAARFARGEPID